ncbi:MAG TPA: pyridoxal 5'-phosphate synthase glutaminase subunit PdxT [Nitrosopumilaceae archaeon]|nr:pyridoxal 5'-phosphate synthase glutaminase subunit PdxT [Nitrosopumilaceae archaeon]
MSLNIGVFAVQGDVEENIAATRAALDELGIKGTVSTVKTPDQISKLDGIILPGGESTTIGQLSLVNGSLKKIKEKIEAGMPAMGICAGLILLAKEVKDHVIGKTEQPLLDLLDVKVERNSFGRQRDSFEADISMESIKIPKFKGVFIRAPSILEVGKNVEVISKLNEKTIAVKQKNILATVFHPELTPDVSMHKYFINMIK